MAASPQIRRSTASKPSQAQNHDRIKPSGTAARKEKGKEKAKPSQVASQAHDPSSATVDHEMAGPVPWQWTCLTDPQVCKTEPVFTKDGSYFFSIVGSSVKIFSVATGEVVSTLSAPPSANSSISATLTSIALNPHNAFQIITGSLDGRLMVWDYMDAVLLQVVNVSQPIHRLCVHADFRDYAFVAAGKKITDDNADKNAVVLRISLKQGERAQPAEVLPVGKTLFPSGLAVSPNGKWLVATAGHKVYVADTSSLQAGFTKYVSPERLTCLAFHPREEYFATGDEKGNVRLWYCLGDSATQVKMRGVEKRAQTTSLHWHAHSVSSVAFTPNGAYLLSGGEESVLVIWQLHTGKKEFVPRLGAPISTVAAFRVDSKDEQFLVGLVDSSYLLIGASNLKVIKSFSRIKLAPMASSKSLSPTEHPSIPLAVHTLTSTVILPSSHPSSIQIYSPSTSKLVSELEISPSNRVSRREEKPIASSSVDRVIISPMGDWMASIDSRRQDEGLLKEVYLKLWWWDSKAGRWILNSRIDRPHGTAQITSMAFSPCSNDAPLHLATVGEDGMLKIWGLRRVKTRSGESEDFWVTRSMFSFRAEIPRSVSWSPDSSLLSVCFGPSVVLYDPLANEMKSMFTPSSNVDLKAALFVGSGRYVVVIGDHDVVLWDVVMRNVRWRHTSGTRILAAVPHSQGDRFIVAHDSDKQSTNISTFGLLSSTPLSIHSIPYDLIAATIFPDRPSSMFVGVSRDRAVVIFGDDMKTISEGTKSVARGLVSDVGSARPHSLFRDIFGASAFTELRTGSLEWKAPSSYTSSRDLVGLTSSPAYLLPPLEQLFDPWIGNTLQPRAEEPDADHVSADDVTEQIREDDESRAMPVDREVPASLSRIVDLEEMIALADLFRRRCIKPPRQHPNGTARDTTMDIPTSKSSLKATLPSSITQLMRESPSSPTPSLISTNGRKRKNSIG